MPKFSEPLFSTVLREATYFDLDYLQYLFQGAASPLEYWSLMQPHNLRQIVISAEQRLFKICRQCMTETYEEYVRQDSRPISSNLKPSFRMMSEVKSFISGNLDVIGKEISQYEYSYQLFAHARQKYERGMIVYGGRATAVGAYSILLDRENTKSMELDVVQQDFEKRHQQLSQNFAEILRIITRHLEGMQLRTRRAISNYTDQFI
jgi:hypothetical protein